MFPDGICLSACIVDVGSVMDAEAQAQWAAWVGRSEGLGVWSSNQGARPCLLGLCSAAVVWGEVPAPPVPLRMHRLGRQRGRSTRMKTWEGAGTPGRETGRGSPPGPAPPVSASPAAETVTCRQHPAASPGSGAPAREAGRLPGKRGACPGLGPPALPLARPQIHYAGAPGANALPSLSPLAHSWAG